MNEPWKNNSVIDLRTMPRHQIWRDLIAVRIVLFIVRVIYRFAAIILSFVYHIFRMAALSLVDAFFFIRERLLKIKYDRAEKKVKEKYELDFFKQLPQRVDKGIKREAIRLRAVVPRRTRLFRALNFILLLFLLSLPFVAYSAWQSLEPVRESVILNTKQAFGNLFAGKDLAEQQNFGGAQNAFEKAGLDFIQAQNDLSSINGLLLKLAAVVPDQRFKAAAESKAILAAGKISAQLGAELALAVQPVADGNVASFLDRFAAHAGPAADDAEALVIQLKKIDPNNLPEEYRDQFRKLVQQADVLSPSLKQAGVLATQASSFLGKQMDKRYLLVFQNNSEKRASGGFMGSFALVDMSKGEIKNIVVPRGGTYDTEAGLSVQVAAPEPLSLVNPQWHLWDANWWPDWPTSAKKIEWFYEKSNGPTVDGVISLTPTVIERLLALHGPIDMTKEYGVVINADNFWQVTQTFSEQKPQQTREPKKIIGDLLTRLMEDLPKDLSAQKVFGLVGLLEQSLSEKQILLYLNDVELEKSVSNFGWDGTIKQTAGDYVMVVDSNIGGQKTDRVILEQIDHTAVIAKDGSITVTLKISRAHSGEKNQPFVGFRNVDWLRVYVPQGSTLLSASGFAQPDRAYFESADPKWQSAPELDNERKAATDPATGTKIYNENNKTVFANWSMVDPGQTAVLTFTYKLPFTIERERKSVNLLDDLLSYVRTNPSKRYELLIQKQPGAFNTTFSSRLSVQKGWQPLWHYPEQLHIHEAGWSFEASLDQDQYLVTLFN